MMEIKKVGVVGCGLMGSGIAQVIASSGYKVVVSEVDEGLLNKGISAVRSSLAIDVRRHRITQEEMDTVMSRITGTTSVSDFSGCDLMIEAVVENLTLKEEIFSQLDKICPKHCILATNTSCLSVTELAKVTARPEKVLGMHFFNPAPLMKLIELIKTDLVSEEVLAIGKEFGKSIGKISIVAPDTPGFIVNRLLMPFMLGAFRLAESGLVAKEDLDEAVRLGLGHPIGPLKLADLVGLDTVLNIARSIYDRLEDPLYEPPAYIKGMVAAGNLGRKSGKGFYEYRQ